MKNFIFTLLIMSAVIFNGCSGGSGSDSSSPSSSDFGLIKGVVFDQDSSKLSNVFVTVKDKSVQTDLNGSFIIENLDPEARVVVSFRKNGYVSTSEVETVNSGSIRYMEVLMKSIGKSEEFSSSDGVTFTDGNGSVVVPQNGVVDQDGNEYNGTVTIDVTQFDPTTDEGIKAFPGEFIGVESNGTEIPIMSYGYMDINLKDSNGNKLQLAQGKTATVIIPIPTSLQATAPDTMPRWYFNEEDGQWHEDGIGTLNAERTAYIGTASHFSIWNNDVGYSRSYVNGNVYSRSGIPLQGARVEIRGVSPRNCWTSGETSTPADGSFTGIPVDANSYFKLYASIYFDGEKKESSIQYFTAKSAGNTLDVGNIYISMCDTGYAYTIRDGEGTCVRDDLVVTWLETEPDGYFSWQEANEWCTQQGYRLPFMAELIDAWYNGGAIHSPSGFEKDTFYWAIEPALEENSAHQGCAMDYDCSKAGYWPDNSYGHPKCVINSTYSNAEPVQRLTFGHAGVDFSENSTTAVWEDQDGYITAWATGPYIDGEGWGLGLWFSVTTTDSNNSHYYIYDSGKTDLADVTYADETKWPQSDEPEPALQNNHVYVIKARDGYVKFKVLSQDLVQWEITTDYQYSPTMAF